MIASTPVARWTWGRDDTADALVQCIRDSLAAYSVLSAHRLACGEPKIKISVAESGRSDSYLFRGELPTGEGVSTEATERLSRIVESELRPGRIGSVDTSVECAGIIVDESGEFLQEGLFQLSISAFADFVGTDLATLSDVWMPYNLKGIPQPVVYAKNAPRLAAALRELAVVLESDTDPEDPTYFGKPTETGVENYFEDDGSPSDVWGRFEIPYRNGIFRQTPKFEPGYRRAASGGVLYFPVHGRSGLLGYLWVSDAEDAASFEARDEADLDGYRAGLVWLDRLHDAYERGLSPTAALIELRSVPDTPVAGVLAGEVPLEVSEFWELRELACR
ncbi:hypothetical protein ACFYNF_26005 [Streptomyces sp. NPDC006641]|uniref:hypothetical protein n=1 Tax=unclassified Streptomyces TaxID=2593676 RepID=UPI0036BDD3A9